MNSRKLLAVSLCGALCLSLAGFTYASAQAADTPKTSAHKRQAPTSFSTMPMALAPMAKIGLPKRTMRKITQRRMLNGGRQRSMKSGLPNKGKNWRR